MNDFQQKIIDTFAIQMVADQEKMALDMILKGYFPSKGWRVGYRTWSENCIDGTVKLHHECFPIKEPTP